MGDIKRRPGLYSRPRKLYDKARIEEENKTVEKYGLKNKREIWKVESKVAIIRKRAKLLISKSDEEKNAFFERLNKMGLSVSNISDVLALTSKNLLDRRLQTFLVSKNLAATPKQARQLIVHKHVLVNGKIVNTPSYSITSALEHKIELKAQKQKEKSNE